MEFLGNRHRRRSSLAHRRAELKGIVRRSRSVILVSAAVGLLVGFGVWGLEYLVDSGLEYVRQRPLWMVAAAPAVGLVAANLILRLGQSVSAATSDEFLRSFHEPNSQLPLLPAMRRLAA
ncbi:MAG: hypothetical protein ACO3US_04820, partial [Ilumatobacteraceae bacterium]